MTLTRRDYLDGLALIPWVFQKQFSPPRSSRSHQRIETWKEIYAAPVAWGWRDYMRECRWPPETEDGLLLTANKIMGDLSLIIPRKWILPRARISLEVDFSQTRLTASFQHCDTLNREPTRALLNCGPTELWANKWAFFKLLSLELLCSNRKLVRGIVVILVLEGLKS